MDSNRAKKNTSDNLAWIIERSPEYFQKLPNKEQDLYNLYVIKKMRQKDIADLWGVTQGSISSRLRRIEERFCFLDKLKLFDTSQIDQDLSKIFNPFEIELLKGMMKTTCQTETARRLNTLFGLSDESKDRSGNRMTQVKVRHQFEKCLEKLKTESQIYHSLFSLIKQNLYILHEVKLPHFSRRLSNGKS